LREQPFIFALLLLEQVLESTEVFIGVKQLFFKGIDSGSELVVLFFIELDEFVVFV
jgi:hypothetical protein